MKKYPFNFKYSRRLRTQLKAALSEDIGPGDTTSERLVPLHVRGKAVVLAREDGVFCGTEVARELLRLEDPNLAVRFFIKEGQLFSKGQTVLQVKGSIRSILEAERTVLNFLGHLSGIATRTKAFVERVDKHNIWILGTRKTTPLWREIEKYAVRVGGGRNHRMGLWDTIFVKENHRPFGDLRRLHRHPRRFHIEVRNLRELSEALRFKPRVILFDNFVPRELRKAVKIARESQPGVILEASGGIRLHNVLRYAATGIDWISVGSLTHSVRSVSFSLLIEEARNKSPK